MNESLNMMELVLHMLSERLKEHNVQVRENGEMLVVRLKQNVYMILQIIVKKI
jgi:hypothetical protein